MKRSKKFHRGGIVPGFRKGGPTPIRLGKEPEVIIPLNAKGLELLAESIRRKEAR